MISFSCKKEDNSTGGNSYYIIDKNLHSMLFDKNSYWIYKNIDSKAIDSVSVAEIVIDTIGPFNIGKGYTSTYQVYNVKYLSSFYGPYSEQYVGYVISRGSKDGSYVYLSSFQKGDSSLNAKIIAIHDSLSVNEISYRYVVEMEIKKDKYIENPMNLYYVNSIGLIKKEIKEDNVIKITWELLRYNVENLKVK